MGILPVLTIIPQDNYKNKMGIPPFDNACMKSPLQLFDIPKAMQGVSVIE